MMPLPVEPVCPFSVGQIVRQRIGIVPRIGRIESILFHPSLSSSDSDSGRLNAFWSILFEQSNGQRYTYADDQLIVASNDEVANFVERVRLRQVAEPQAPPASQRFIVGQIVRCTFRPNSDRTVVGRVYNIILGSPSRETAIYIEDVEGAHFVALQAQTVLSRPEEVEDFRQRRTLRLAREQPPPEPVCRFRTSQIVRHTEEGQTGVGRIYHTEYNNVRPGVRPIQYVWTIFIEHADQERFMLNEEHVTLATPEEVVAYTDAVEANHQRAGERVYMQRQRQMAEDRNVTLSHMSRYRNTVGFGIGDYVQVIRGVGLVHGTRGHITELYCRAYPEGPRWHVTLEVEHGNRVRSYVSNLEMVTMVTNLSGPITYMQYRYMDTLMAYETEAEARDQNNALNGEARPLPPQRFAMFMTCYTCGIRDHEMRTISSARNFIKQHEGHYMLMYENPGGAGDGRGADP